MDAAIMTDPAMARQLRTEEREKRIKQWEKEAATSSEEFDRAISQLSTEPTPAFSPDDTEGLVAYMEEHGYAVVRGAATPSDVDTAKSMLWEFLETEVGMLRNDPETWNDDAFARLGDLQNGIINGKDFNQDRTCWFIRTLPNVRRSFEALWEGSPYGSCTDLITSFDGGNIFRPYHRSGKAKHKTEGGWWHVDQGPTKLGKQSIQGLVSLYDATEQTGGLCVIPGSHRQHTDLMSYAPHWEHDFVLVPEPDINPLICGGKLVQCKAGDLVLWDSRTVHCNTPALKDPTIESGYKDDDLLRAVVYVCMSPRGMASAETQKLRRAVYTLRVGTSHWPHEVRESLAAYCELVDAKDIDEAFQSRFKEEPWQERCHALI